MSEKQAGLTALAMAYARAYHATHATHKIFDDFLADRLFTAEEHAQTDRDWANMLQYIAPDLAAATPDPQAQLDWVTRLTNGPITLGRSRYAEDSLEQALQAGVRQYVILGAGLDTFAYRRPELAGRLQVFELDHPTTQALKRQRVARLGRAEPTHLHYLAVDFAQESLAQALGRSAYDPHQLSFFSWLGVSFYLEPAVVFETLRAVAALAPPGSQIVFDYMDAQVFDPARAGKRIQQMHQMAAALGEPIKSGFEPGSLAGELARLGLALEENLSPEDMEARYFRGSGYRAAEHFHLARARVGI